MYLYGTEIPGPYRPWAQAHTGLRHRPSRKVQLPCALLETSLMYKQVLGIKFQEVIG